MTKILWKCSDEKLRKSNLFKFENFLKKKYGIEIGDVISEFKIENLDRTNRATIYPFSLLILFIFGYLNYRRGKKI